MTIWRMRNACWIPKATNTHLEYVILFAFTLKQWLHQRDSMLFISTLSLLLMCYRILARILWSLFECRDSRAAYVIVLWTGSYWYLADACRTKCILPN